MGSERGPRLALLVGLASALAVADYVTPMGIVIGNLMTIPVLLSALNDDSRAPHLVFGTAIGGFLLATVFGAGPITPPVVYLPNRALTLLIMGIAYAVALAVQRDRRAADRNRREIEARGDLNRLLLSLLAHDLRAPLSMAGQALDYVQGAVEHGDRIDRQMLRDVRSRLQRSIRATSLVLEVARRDLEQMAAPQHHASLYTPAALVLALSAEIESFQIEAGLGGRTIVADWSGLETGFGVADALAMQQALAITLDNSLRYALPGAIRIRGWVEDGRVYVSVLDPGPGSNARQDLTGAGLGVQLCRALLEKAQGGLKLDLAAGSGSEALFWTPVRDA